MHGVRDRGGAAGNTDDAPVPAGRGDGGVGVDGLVGAVEVAQSEVDDAGGRGGWPSQDSREGGRELRDAGGVHVSTSPSWSRRAHGRWAGTPVCRGTGLLRLHPPALRGRVPLRGGGSRLRNGNWTGRLRTPAGRSPCTPGWRSWSSPTRGGGMRKD